MSFLIEENLLFDTLANTKQIYLNLKKYEDLKLILNKLLKDEKYQTRVSLLLELVS